MRCGAKVPAQHTRSTLLAQTLCIVVSALQASLSGSGRMWLTKHGNTLRNGRCASGITHRVGDVSPSSSPYSRVIVVPGITTAVKRPTKRRNRVRTDRAKR